MRKPHLPIRIRHGLFIVHCTLNDVILSVLFHWIIDIRETLILTEVSSHILIYIHIMISYDCYIFSPTSRVEHVPSISISLKVTVKARLTIKVFHQKLGQSCKLYFCTS